MFVNAIEESAKNRPVRTPVAARQIKGEEELRKFMKEWEKANADMDSSEQAYGLTTSISV